MLVTGQKSVQDGVTAREKGNEVSHMPLQRESFQARVRRRGPQSPKVSPELRGQDWESREAKAAGLCWAEY